MNKQTFKTLFSLLFTIGFLTQLSAEVTYVTNLKATEHELGHILEWTTSLESNSRHFIVEKSMDNVKFSKLTTIEAKGNSVKNNSYVFVDMDLGTTNDKYYYRLRQVDMDGTFSHSKVASITKVESNHFSVEDFYTTEMPEEYILSYKSKVAGMMNLDIVNTADQSVVHTETYTASVGFNDLNLDMKNIPSGNYELVFTLDNEKETIAINKTGMNQEINMMSRKASGEGSKN